MDWIGLDHDFQQTLWIGFGRTTLIPRFSYRAYHFDKNRLKCALCLISNHTAAQLMPFITKLWWFMGC